MRKTVGLVMMILTLASCSKKPAQMTQTLPLVKVIQPVQKDLTIFKEYVGHIDPYATVDITPQVTGKLTEVFFEEASSIQQGQKLFAIDNRPYLAQLAAAKAKAAQTLASSELAKKNAKRYAALYQDGFVSQIDYDQIINTVSLADANEKQSRADLIQAKINLDYCTITAPISGISGSLLVDVGNIVSSKPLVTINQIDPICASFYIPQSDLSLVTTGMETAIYSEQTHLGTGKLTLIDNKIDLQTSSLFLQATLENSNKKLWPGQFVTVKLILGVEKDALLLDKSAINLSQNGPFLFIVKEDNTIEQRSIKVGKIEGEMQSVTSGLLKGEKVVVEGQQSLLPGMKVKVVADSGA